MRKLIYYPGPIFEEDSAVHMAACGKKFLAYEYQPETSSKDTASYIHVYVPGKGWAVLGEVDRMGSGEWRGSNYDSTVFVATAREAINHVLTILE